MVAGISFVFEVLDWVIVDVPLSLTLPAVVQDGEGVSKVGARVGSLCVTVVFACATVVEVSLLVFVFSELLFSLGSLSATSIAEKLVVPGMPLVTSPVQLTFSRLRPCCNVLVL